MMEERRVRQEELAARTAERDALLERMNVDGFWQNPVESRAVTERFRELDVMIQCETRLMRALDEVLSEVGEEREDGEKESSKYVGAGFPRPSFLLPASNLAARTSGETSSRTRNAAPRRIELLDEAERLLDE